MINIWFFPVKVILASLRKDILHPKEFYFQRKSALGLPWHHFLTSFSCGKLFQVQLNKGLHQTPQA